jgi:Skp family chaperone for outer membrane proteins
MRRPVRRLGLPAVQPRHRPRPSRRWGETLSAAAKTSSNRRSRPSSYRSSCRRPRRYRQYRKGRRPRRLSSASCQGDKELAARRQKLNQDAQKEQVALRDLGQALANDRTRLSPEQIRTKERELQDRVNESRRKFGERNRIIQEAGQYVMAQIDRTLEQVAQQVAASRGVNLVLNRAQILGTTADFDLTPQVAQVLNQVLSSVVVPPDGVSPLAMTPPADAAQTGSGLIAAPNATSPAAVPEPAAPPAQATNAPAAKPAQKH